MKQNIKIELLLLKMNVIDRKEYEEKMALIENELNERKKALEI